MHAGTLIIGGGPMGAWLALEATRYADPLRSPVVLVDTGDPEAAHGPLEVFDEEPLHDVAHPLARQLRDGAQALAHFEPQTGRTIGFCRTGAILLEPATAEPTDEEQRREVDRQGRGLVIDHPETARYRPRAALVDAVRCHREVLGLARTRGAITRPGTRVTALLREGGRVVGVETTRGTFYADAVVLTSASAARELVPDWTPELHTEPWSQASFASPLIHAEAGAFGDLPPGGMAELGTDPAALDAFFSAGGELESPHPALLERSGAQVAPNPLAGTLVLTAKADPTGLAARAPLHGTLGSPELTTGTTVHTPDGLPLVGELAPSLHVAIALGRHLQTLPPSLAPGLAAAIHAEPFTAYNPALLAPRR